MTSNTLSNFFNFIQDNDGYMPPPDYYFEKDITFPDTYKISGPLSFDNSNTKSNLELPKDVLEVTTNPITILSKNPIRWPKKLILRRGNLVINKEALYDLTTSGCKMDFASNVKIISEFKHYGYDSNIISNITLDLQGNTVISDIGKSSDSFTIKGNFIVDSSNKYSVDLPYNLTITGFLKVNGMKEWDVPQGLNVGGDLLIENLDKEPYEHRINLKSVIEERGGSVGGEIKSKN